MHRIYIFTKNSDSDFDRFGETDTTLMKTKHTNRKWSNFAQDRRLFSGLFFHLLEIFIFTFLGNFLSNFAALHWSIWFAMEDEGCENGRKSHRPAHYPVWRAFSPESVPGWLLCFLVVVDLIWHGLTGIYRSLSFGPAL